MEEALADCIVFSLLLTFGSRSRRSTSSLDSNAPLCFECSLIRNARRVVDLLDIFQ